MWVPLLLALFPLTLFGFFCSLIPDLSLGLFWTWKWDWISSLGLSLSFRADGLALLMSLLISGIGTLITIYGGAYLKGHKYFYRFYFYLFLFMLAMLGIVLSDNLFGLFVFWELTSISSYLLIGFKHEYESSRVSALQAFLVTGVGGLAMFAGFVLLAHLGGSYEFSVLLGQSSAIQNSSLYPWITVLVLLGALTKSAQFPFHFWLPNAMAAPTPVSAYLHSATMVKAGVFLMARFTPLLGGTLLWQSILVVAGFLTIITAAMMSLGQRDFKKILAYTTLAALGTLTMLLGLGTPLAFKAFIAFLLAHALYKASWFMLAGSIDHETGTRDLGSLSLLRHKMPVTAAISVLAGIAFIGLPPSWSFIAKESALEAAIDLFPSWTGFVGILGLFIGSLSFVYLGALVVWGVFFAGPLVVDNPESDLKSKKIHEAPWGFSLGPIVLSVLGIVFGITSNSLTDFLLEPAAFSLSPLTQNFEFSLWHGLTPALLITVCILICGLALYCLRSKVLKLFTRMIQSFSWTPESLYFWKIRNIPTVSKTIFDFIQNGNLRIYLAVILSFALCFAFWPLFYGFHLKMDPIYWSDLRVEEICIGIALISGALMTLFSRKTFVALAATGIVGLSVAIFYVFYGAPDLAMTQVLVEALSLILVILVLFHFSRVAIKHTLRFKIFSVLVSLGLSLLLGIAMMLSLENKYFESISKYYSENSYLLAHGRNIVNVILVDFRGWDTMGEITVLGLASIGVYALLRWRKGSREGDTNA